MLPPGISTSTIAMVAMHRPNDLKLLGRLLYVGWPAAQYTEASLSRQICCEVLQMLVRRVGVCSATKVLLQSNAASEATNLPQLADDLNPCNAASLQLVTDSADQTAG